MYMPTADSRSLSAYASIEPCIVMGCTHEYGHVGQHDLDEELLKEQQEMSSLTLADTDLCANRE